MQSRLAPFVFFLLLLLNCQCGNQPKSSGYTLAIDPTWYPMEVAGQEKNILAFSYELLVAIGKEENLQFSLRKMNWNNVLFGLRKEQYDACLSTLRPYSFYLKTYSFSNPFLRSGPVIILPKNSTSTDIKGKIIGVVIGSSAALILQSTPKVILKGYDSIPQVLDALDQGHIEAAATPLLIAQKYVRDLYSKQFKIASEPLNNVGLRLVTLHNRETVLMDRFNRGLEKLKKNGQYEKLLKKWGLSPDGSPEKDLDRKVEAFIQGLF